MGLMGLMGLMGFHLLNGRVGRHPCQATRGQRTFAGQNCKRLMKLFGKGGYAQPLVRHVLLLSFWAIWMALPFLMLDGDDTRHRALFLKILPASLSNVILFFLLAEWLGPYLLRRKQVQTFLLTVLGLSVFFLLFQGFLKNWLLMPDNKGVGFHLFRSIIHVFFAAAFGTGYALVRHTLGEEKSQQDARQERLRSELSFLRSQISPHFIFNILNSIVYLIRSKSPQAEHATMQLSALMRYMLYESNDTQIPLDKEIGYLSSYIDLQKIRFEEDVEIRLNMNGEVSGQLIEPMLMIPFVENAFKHGVGLIDSPLIDISVSVTEKMLCFTVKNKITPDTPAEKDNSSGIGLQNVRRRLELLYPDAHELDILEDGAWFEARLRIRFP